MEDSSAGGEQVRGVSGRLQSSLASVLMSMTFDKFTSYLYILYNSVMFMIRGGWVGEGLWYVYLGTRLLNLFMVPNLVAGLALVPGSKGEGVTMDMKTTVGTMK